MIDEINKSKKIMNSRHRERMDNSVILRDKAIKFHSLPPQLHPQNPYDKNKINISIHAHSDLDKKTFACWGDYWVKEYLKQSLIKQFGDEINLNVESAFADVIIYCFGSPFEQRNSQPFFYNPKSLNIVWHYSHPEKMDVYETKKYDYIFVASSKWLREMKNWSTHTIIDDKPLYACTDLSLIEKLPTSWDKKPDILFVGNARGGSKYGRKSVKWLDDLYKELNLDWNVYLYGAKWEREQYKWSNKWYKGQYFSYEDLPSAYYNSKVNLIDGHDNMRNEGFVPAKVFDTLASEGWAVMEYNDGIKELFGDDVLMFKTKGEMYEKIHWSLNNQDKIEPIKKKLAKIAKSYSYEEVSKRLFYKIKELL